MIEIKSIHRHFIIKDFTNINLFNKERRKKKLNIFCGTEGPYLQKYIKEEQIH